MLSASQTPTTDARKARSRRRGASPPPQFDPMNDRYVRSFSNSRGLDLDTNQLRISAYVLAKSTSVTHDLAVLNPRAISPSSPTWEETRDVPSVSSASTWVARTQRS